MKSNQEENKVYKKQKTVHDFYRASPLPTQEELSDYYRNKYYQESDTNYNSYDTEYTSEELDHKRFEAKLCIHALSKLNVKKGSTFAEFGCGEGFLLDAAHKAGYEVAGVDFSEFGISKWHPYLKDYFKADDLFNHLDQLKRDGRKFDVCATKNVLEHVLDPEKMMAEMKSLLNPGGYVLVTVPNDFSKLQNRLLELEMTNEADWFCPPDHLTYFNTSNIVPFLESQGYKIEDMYCSFPVDVFLMHKGSNYVFDSKQGKSAHFARVRMDLLIQEAGLDNALELYRSFARCGIGRNITVVLSSK
ncbi:MAG: class I SAM-dependent methyltransferase [Candidatus Paracaedibacteraceae bacterium]|nr:class I SAM-dependent methyltransferase [Candidatus Paracaedibacteraceae bacterium]